MMFILDYEEADVCLYYSLYYKLQQRCHKIIIVVQCAAKFKDDLFELPLEILMFYFEKGQLQLYLSGEQNSIPMP